MVLRFVRSSDAARILEIYAPYITDSAVSFETELPSEAEFSRRIESIAAEYPFVVCEDGGHVIGYAYAHRLFERAAYQWAAELSVYVDVAHQRKGIAGTMYRFIFEVLKLQNVHTVYAVVTADNTASLNMHEELGFRPIGTFCKSGYKHGKWHDVVWLDKRLLSYDNPEPLLSIEQVDPAALIALLEWSNMELRI